MCIRDRYLHKLILQSLLYSSARDTASCLSTSSYFSSRYLASYINFSIHPWTTQKILNKWPYIFSLCALCLLNRMEYWCPDLDPDIPFCSINAAPKGRQFYNSYLQSFSRVGLSSKFNLYYINNGKGTDGSNPYWILIMVQTRTVLGNLMKLLAIAWITITAAPTAAKMGHAGVSVTVSASHCADFTGCELNPLLYQDMDFVKISLDIACLDIVHVLL